MSLLYRQQILDHYANPRNKGQLQNPDSTAFDWNPLCGDKVKIDLKFDKGQVSEIKFDGQGCAISQAASSMLTEKITGKTEKEIAKIKEGDVLELLGVPISPGRMKCALLGWLVLRKALGLPLLTPNL